MSVSQFPNADVNQLDRLIDLLVALVPNPDPAVNADIELIFAAYMNADIELIFAAYMYAAAEQIINMQMLPLYHTLDAQTLRDIRALIASGT